MKALWDPIVEKFEKRLSVWKSSKLSLGGRIVLINLPMSSLPFYFMLVFKCPVAVIKKMEGIECE